MKLDTYETSLSDFRKMTVSVFKMHFPKRKPSVDFYCNYKSFRDKKLRAVLDIKLSKYDIYNMEY